MVPTDMDVFFTDEKPVRADLDGDNKSTKLADIQGKVLR